MQQEKIWDHFQSGCDVADEFLRSRPRYEYVAERIMQGERVLNIGVGRGGLEELLVSKGAIVSCLDPGEQAIEVLRQRHDLGERAQVGYSQALPFPDGSFEVVVMSEVLEHLKDDVLALTVSEVKRVLRPGGRFIGTVPAEEVLQDSQVMCPHCGVAFHRWGHVQRFDAARLQELLAGEFGAVNIGRHYFGDWHGLNVKGRLALVLKKLLVAFGSRGSGETFFFCGNRP